MLTLLPADLDCCPCPVLTVILFADVSLKWSDLQVEEAKLKERQAAAAAAADEEAGGCARKASAGDVPAAVQVQNGEGDALSISSSVVQACQCPDSVLWTLRA